MITRNDPVKTNGSEITDPVTIEKNIIDYFESCDKDAVSYSLEGLCDALGIDREQVLKIMKQDRHPSADLLKKACGRIRRDLVEKALSKETSSTLAIFLLKKNFYYEKDPEPDKEIHLQSLDLNHEQLSEIQSDESV